MGQSWYGEPLVPDGAKRAVSGTSCNLQQNTGPPAAPQKDQESRIQNPDHTSQNGPFPARLPRSIRQQEAGEHSCACLIEPGDSILLRQGVADCTRLSENAKVVHAHGILGICLGIAGMAGAHWPVLLLLLVLLQLQPAGAVGGGRWGGYGKERSFQVPRALH